MAIDNGNGHEVGSFYKEYKGKLELDKNIYDDVQFFYVTKPM